MPEQIDKRSIIVLYAKVNYDETEECLDFTL